MAAVAGQGLGTGASGQELLVEARGAIRILTLNRPESFNAANPGLHGRLARIWPELAAELRVPIVAAVNGRCSRASCARRSSSC